MLDQNFYKKQVFNASKKIPTEMQKKWRSIEFEMIFNKWEDLDDFVKFVEEHKYDQFITIKDDGSIHEKHYENIGKEIVVSYCSGSREEIDKKYPTSQIVKDVCHFLVNRAYINKTCGTHVHFDMRGLKKDRVQQYGDRLAIAVPALKQLVPKSRRTSRFCHDIINKMVAAGDHEYEYWEEDEQYAFNIDHDRYAFINMQAYAKHKTIEVRGHSGTLNARKILNWIRICEVIMTSDPPEGKKEITTLEDLAKSYPFSDNIKAYIAKRAAELIKPPKPADVPVEPNNQAELNPGGIMSIITAMSRPAE